MKLALQTVQSREVRPARPQASARHPAPPVMPAASSRMPALNPGPSTTCERLLDDAAIIDRVNRGDQQAAQDLVTRLRPTVLKCVRRRLPRWASEEDLVQTAF